MMGQANNHKFKIYFSFVKLKKNIELFVHQRILRQRWPKKKNSFWIQFLDNMPIKKENGPESIGALK